LKYFFSEEILKSNTALWLSNDGHLMLYGTFNDSQVEQQNFAWYGSSAGDAHLYPEIRSLR
jgi:hypothetical protein